MSLVYHSVFHDHVIIFVLYSFVVMVEWNVRVESEWVLVVFVVGM